jgi:enoyl-CoA hydratase/carnithine racemase
MTDEVRYERVGAAAVLTIDRPHRRNAVDGPTAERLREGLDAFEASGRSPDGSTIRAARSASRGARRPSQRSPPSRAGAWRAGSSSRCGATCA